MKHAIATTILALAVTGCATTQSEPVSDAEFCHAFTKYTGKIMDLRAGGMAEYEARARVRNDWPNNRTVRRAFVSLTGVIYDIDSRLMYGTGRGEFLQAMFDECLAADGEVF